MLLLCTPLKTALIALIRDLTVPSHSVYGYSDILGEKKRTWVWAMDLFLSLFKYEGTFLQYFLCILYSVVVPKGLLPACDGA